MAKISKNITLQDFEAMVSNFEHKLNDLIYIKPQKQKGSRLAKLEAMFTKIHADGGAFFNADDFEDAARQASVLEHRLIEARDNLRCEYEAWKENPDSKTPEAIVNTFEERVNRAMKTHLQRLRSVYSPKSELYAAAVPLVASVLTKSINMAAYMMGKPARMEEISLAKPQTTSRLAAELTQKYKELTDELTPDDEVTESTPLNLKRNK